MFTIGSIESAIGPSWSAISFPECATSLAIVAGTSKLEYRSFALFAYAGATLWVSTFVFIGYHFGERWPQILGLVEQNLKLISVVLGAIVLAYLLFRFSRQKKLLVQYSKIWEQLLAEHRPANFYASTVGKKAALAVSGLVLFLFVIGHLIGNLQIYEGSEKLNNYAKFLRSIPAALWTVRITLLVMVLLHIWSSVQLALLKFDSKSAWIAHVKKKATKSSYASTHFHAYWSGPIILAFVIYHLLDFTLRHAKSAFSRKAMSTPMWSPASK